MMESTKVAINGFGTIGKRVADAVDAQDDMEVVGVTKTGPSFGCELAIKKRFPLYCTLDDKERISSSHSIKSWGGISYFDKLFSTKTKLISRSWIH